MAGRRMFARTVVCTGRFVDLPDSAQALYFQLGMNADDDGFAEGALILRMCRKEEADLRLLEQAGLVRVFGEELITYLVDWKVNNQIRKDRYHESPYAHLLEEAPAPAAEPETTQEEEPEKEPEAPEKETPKAPEKQGEKPPKRASRKPPRKGAGKPPAPVPRREGFHIDPDLLTAVPAQNPVWRIG